ncbi:hypothetical protein XBO1_2570015 [Xenorhabdus bovienii str. oregonense]|uniref:Uncharacterized protein n=1 Tax=Xenorhabdus bovienii str. oregonense TaxID=1398202 RepID=A0A077P994_XENBV|nr:hypothetical protein XBO1_2570015 [Xenorhabdus bovienii str. oregonense]
MCFNKTKLPPTKVGGLVQPGLTTESRQTVLPKRAYVKIFKFKVTV